MYIGLTFKRERYSEITEMLQDHARLFDRKLEMYLMVDLNLLELHFKSMDLAVIDRVLLYDYEELGNWENFKRFSNLCKKFGLEFSIIKKTVDLHSDVDVPIGYLTEIIQ
ncbi:hypothetical protein E3U55_09030 [Filobacillus milosensis]|uniref:Uncharacterized protein n=1 Tax=Filobacillus milosensis TaxID=94137 RepID=A0A4Y8IKH0_9BACI|nr:hypothetical protein [Filobacillus milosensis]TFB21444.1 hypothetical protein E3U55_09030 [Filobacillus milosensis]